MTLKRIFTGPQEKKSPPYLEVVVSLQEGTRVHVGGVELLRLRAGVPVEPEEDVVLHLAVVDVGGGADHVGQTDVQEVVNVLGGERAGMSERENV